MKTLFTKQTVLAATLAVLLSTTAQANQLINNNAQGMIHGNVQQGYESSRAPKTEIAVGSIKADYAANNDAQGFVSGDVIQQGREENILRVGSIEAANARGNRAEARIDGAVLQYADHAVAEVGSIHAEEELSDAYNNTASGWVAGDVIQQGTNAKLNVGSIGSRN